MTTYREQLDKALTEARRTGCRIVRVFNRDQFTKEFPNFSKDPRYAMTPESFILEITPMEALTVGELRRLCAGAGDSPLAIQKAMSVEGFSDDTVVRILREDLDILTNASDGSGKTAVLLPVPVPDVEPTEPSED